ncbi:hypothetical protein HOF65_02440 [bacterium]|nr:hypothetical protein [bacterium]MBT3852859.1 hypothetical protein [bacterium]MBT6779561.1 hypothetical protein [bacterium]
MTSATLFSLEIQVFKPNHSSLNITSLFSNSLIKSNIFLKVSGQFASSQVTILLTIFILKGFENSTCNFSSGYA